MNLDGEA